MKLLVASFAANRGAIQVDHVPLSKAERALKSKLGYLPQDFGLFDTLTVTQFLDYMAALKGVPHPKDAIQQAIRAVNLEEKAKARIRTLSGGQRQRVGIAQGAFGRSSLPDFRRTHGRLGPGRTDSLPQLVLPARQKTVWCCSLRTSSKMCSRYVTRSSSCITGRSCSRAHRNSSFNLLSATWGVFWEKDEMQERGLHITARVNNPQGRPLPGRWRMSSRPMPRWRSRHWRTPTSICSPETRGR